MKVKETAVAYRTKPFTYRDYLDLPEDEHRYQVINGELVMTPSPVTLHQRVARRIDLLLEAHVKKHRSGEVFHAPLDVVLDDHNVYQPDVFFISNENSDIVTERNIQGAPDLVVEVISPSSGYYDMVEKKDVYGQSGVQEYWLVDPKKHTVELYCLRESMLQLVERAEDSGVIQSRLLQGFEFALSGVFGF